MPEPRKYAAILADLAYDDIANHHDLNKKKQIPPTPYFQTHRERPTRTNNYSYYLQKNASGSSMYGTKEYESMVASPDSHYSYSGHDLVSNEDDEITESQMLVDDLDMKQNEQKASTYSLSRLSSISKTRKENDKSNLSSPRWQYSNHSRDLVTKEEGRTAKSSFNDILSEKLRSDNRISVGSRSRKASSVATGAKNYESEMSSPIRRYQDILSAEDGRISRVSFEGDISDNQESEDILDIYSRSRKSSSPMITGRKYESMVPTPETQRSNRSQDSRVEQYDRSQDSRVEQYEDDLDNRGNNHRTSRDSRSDSKSRKNSSKSISDSGSSGNQKGGKQRNSSARGSRSQGSRAGSQTNAQASDDAENQTNQRISMGQSLKNGLIVAFFFNMLYRICHGILPKVIRFEKV